MSYNFGQFRKSQFSSYLTPLTYTLHDLETSSPSSKSVVFLDKTIDLRGTDNIIGWQSNSSYYLKIKIYKQEQKQIIDIKLRNNIIMVDKERIIKNIVIPAGEQGDFSIFEIIITPTEDHYYNQLDFILNRELIDYNILNEDGTYGRRLNIVIERLDKIYNIINFLSPSINGSKILKQIGIQGPPGLLMSIDGEEIRIGRSGLYEINHGINISFIGFVVEADEKYFILDYQY